MSRTETISTPRDQLLEQALALPFEHRLRLAQALWSSVADQYDPPLTEAWRGEIHRRIKAHERGEVELLDGEQVLRRLREKYGS